MYLDTTLSGMQKLVTQYANPFANPSIVTRKASHQRKHHKSFLDLLSRLELALPKTRQANHKQANTMMEPPSSLGSLTSLPGLEDAGYCLVERVKTKSKTILHRMALDFPDNAVTAIMGPSGSGESRNERMNFVFTMLYLLCLTFSHYAR